MTISGAAFAVEMHNISVEFGTVKANDNVSLNVAPGEIHALLGENGAGKTTLVRVLAGLLKPSAGSIIINGQTVSIPTPQAARGLGIGMVHQHFMLVPTLTVAQNISLGLPEVSRWFPNMETVADDISALANKYGLDVDPRVKPSDLSIAGQQRVEILKALYRGAKILILDEPTAVLTPQEVNGLFEILRSLAKQGVAIIFIGHKLHEIMTLTDKITVLHKGVRAATFDTSTTTEREIARAMIGNDVIETITVNQSAPLGSDILVVNGISALDSRKAEKLKNISLSVKAGEIVGIAGVDGNGQQDLIEAIVGLLPIKSGSVTLANQDVTHHSVAHRLSLGLSHIPEDRHKYAMFESLPIADNIASEKIDTPTFSKNGWLNGTSIYKTAEEIIKKFDVRCFGPKQHIGHLSGGNQQKVILGRALLTQPKILLAVQPTRGLDIGATTFLHNQILKLKEHGGATLLVSMELDELITLCDRIIVMLHGEIVGELTRSEFSREKLGLMMTGEI